MKQTIFIFIFLLICTVSYSQVGRISFSSAGGSNPNVPLSIGESFGSSGGEMGVGSRKNTAGQIVSVNEPKSQKQNRIILYPNPTSGSFTVQVAGDDENDYSVLVSDMSGKRYFAVSGNKNAVVINMEGLAAAPYLVSVFNSRQELLFNQTILKK